VDLYEGDNLIVFLILVHLISGLIGGFAFDGSSLCNKGTAVEYKN